MVNPIVDPRHGHASGMEAALLSPNQEARLVLETLAGWRGCSARGAFNCAVALRLRGAIEVRAIEAAVDALLARHVNLRTSLACVQADPRDPVQGHLFGGLRVEQAVVDHASVRGRAFRQHRVLRGSADLAWRELAQALVDEPFDYARPPLLRAALAHVADQEHVLCLVAPHLVADRWSLQILQRELAESYRLARHSELPPPCDDGAVEHARTERGWLATPGAARARRYWADQATTASTALVRLLDVPFRVVDAAPGLHRKSRLAKTVVRGEAIVRTARACGMTVYMLTLAAVHMALATRLGRRSLQTVTHFANRGRQEAESVVGWLASAHPIGTNPEREKRVTDYLREVRATLLMAARHQRVPEAAVWAEQLARNARRPVGQTGTVYVSVDTVSPSVPVFDGLIAERVRLTQDAEGAVLHFLLSQAPGAWALAIEYSEGIFDPAAIDDLLDRVIRLLHVVPEHGEQTIGTLTSAR